MTFTAAVAGKGGVGKTSVAALLVKYFTEEKGGTVLAVDADPNSNLDEKLGVMTGKTLGSLREEVSGDMDSKPAGVSKAERAEYLVRTAIVEGRKFDLLAMGRSEGPGCYCYVNNLLRTLVDSISEKYPYVVIDNEAGMEHLSRRTTRSVDMLLVVSDTSPTGLKTAGRLRKLADEMGLKRGKTVLLLNRAGEKAGAAGESIGESAGGNHTAGFDMTWQLPEDRSLNDYNSECKSLLGLPRDSPAYGSLGEMMERMLK